jgi:hypothetical protein
MRPIEIITTGTDQTSQLKDAISITPIGGVIDVKGGDLVINSPIDFGGKVIKMESGTKMTGTGTINNVLVDANAHEYVFDPSLTFTNLIMGQTVLSVKNFGATGNGTTDDWFAVQKTVDTAIANNINTVLSPTGIYRMGQALIMYRWDGTDYKFFTLEFKGESSFWQAGNTRGTRFIFSDPNSFCIGFQRAKGLKIDRILVQGPFQPPTIPAPAWYHLKEHEFTDGVTRDSPQSACVAIAGDPFSYKLPADGGYPSNHQMYNGLPSAGGSTGVEITDVSLGNVIAGYCSSINGITLNSEITLIDKIQVRDCRYGIAGTQAQEKANIVRNFACWGNVYCPIKIGGVLGAGTPGNWKFQGLNMAGGTRKLISLNSGGYFATHLEDVFAEIVFNIEWSSGVGGSLTSSELGFAYPSEVSGTHPQAHISGSGITYRDTILRIYGSGKPIVINGSNTFEHCSFEVPPIELIPGSNTFIRCGYLSGGHVRGNHDSLLWPVGDTIFEDNGYTNGIRFGFRSSNITPRTFITLDYGDVNRRHNIVLNADLSFTISANARELSIVRVGEYIFGDKGDGSKKLMGEITSIDGDKITVSYSPEGITSGTYFLHVSKLKPMIAFIGNTTEGSPTITGIKMLFGNLNNLSYYPCIIEGAIPFAMGAGWKYSAAVVNSNTANTLTLAHPADRTITDHLFISPSAEIFLDMTATRTGIESLGGDRMALPVGSEIKMRGHNRMRVNKWVVASSGYIGSGNPKLKVVPANENGWSVEDIRDLSWYWPDYLHATAKFNTEVGTFMYDPNDKTSADDGVNVLVSEKKYRYKKI